ncbi:MAG: DUF1573 domain-containing protein [Armatimonadetes bacterium]|nr:DUF1573 domain-containing protein [Armatimonadota bacterium]
MKHLLDKSAQDLIETIEWRFTVTKADDAAAPPEIVAGQYFIEPETLREAVHLLWRRGQSPVHEARAARSGEVLAMCEFLPNSVRPIGNISSRPLPESEKALSPYEPPSLPFRRLLPFIVENAEIEVKGTAGTRQSVFCLYPAKVFQANMKVCVAWDVDLASARPFEELRMYAVLGQHVGEESRHPCGAEGAEVAILGRRCRLVLRKVPLSFTNVAGGGAFCTAWNVYRMDSARGESHVGKVELSEVKFNENQGEDYAVDFPDGTLVTDEFRFRVFVAGEAEARVQPGNVSERELLGALAKAVPGGQIEIPASEGQLQPSSCGLNCIFCMLALQGAPVPLAQLRESAKGVSQIGFGALSIHELVSILQEYGVRARAVKLGDHSIRKVCGVGAIAHLEPEGGTGHYVMVISHDSLTDTLKVVDPPFVGDIPFARFCREWDGIAVVPEGPFLEWFERRSYVSWGIVTACALSFLGLTVLSLCLRRRSRGTRPQALTVALLGAITLVGSGCSEKPVVAVLGSPRVALGEIDPGVNHTAHTFTIENRTASPQVLHKIFRSCGCLRAVLEPETIPPGDRATLRLVLGLIGAKGEKSFHATLFFQDPSVAPIEVALSAHLRAKYLFSAYPPLFAVPPGELSGCCSHRFILREMSTGTGAPGDGHEVRIIGNRFATLAGGTDWSTRGEHMVKEKEVDVTFDVPWREGPIESFFYFQFCDLEGQEIDRVKIVLRRS